MSTTLDDIRRTLALGEVRVDMELIQPAGLVTASAREEVEYARFARAFGWNEGESSEPRLVSVAATELARLKREADPLPGLLTAAREKSTAFSDDDERAYAAFALRFGWD